MESCFRHQNNCKLKTLSTVTRNKNKSYCYFFFFLYFCGPLISCLSKFFYLFHSRGQVNSTHLTQSIVLINKDNDSFQNFIYLTLFELGTFLLLVIFQFFSGKKDRSQKYVDFIRLITNFNFFQCKINTGRLKNVYILIEVPL